MTYEADYKSYTTNFPDHHASFDWMEIFEAFFLNSKLRGVHADTAMVSGLRRAARTGRVRAADNRAGRPRLRGAQGAPAMSCASAHDLFESTPHGPDYVIAGQPCKCGSHHFNVEPGKGPHAAGLRCAVCGKHHGWMSKVEYEEYLGR